MQMMALLSGLSARFIGLFGLVATGILAASAYEVFLRGDETVHAAILATLGLFCFVKSGQFLSPRIHARALARTNRAPSRFGFGLLGLVWLIVSAATVLDFAIDAGVSSDSPLARLLVLTVLAALFLFAFFFLWGAGYRSRRADNAEAAAQDPDAPTSGHAPMSIFTADAPPPRLQAKRYEIMQEAKNSLRRRDVWDYFALVMMATGVFGGFLAFRFSNTVQTAQLDRLIDANLIPIFAAVTLLFSAPMFLFTVLRRASTPALARMGRLRKLVFALFATPFIGALLTLVIPFDLAPHVWNLATTNPEATLRYEVVEVERTGRVRDCVLFALVDDPGVTVRNCGLGADFAGFVVPGIIVDATGELSPFGHSMTEVTILR